MSDQWVPKGYTDPDDLSSETVIEKKLSTLWGGTGVSAIDIADLKSQLGITSSAGDQRTRLHPTRKLQADPSGGTFTGIGCTSIVVSPGGAATTTPHPSGLYVTLLEDASVPSPARVQVAAPPVMRRYDSDVVFTFKPSMVASIGASPSASVYNRIWVGLCSVTPSGYDVPQAAWDMVALSYSRAIGTTWVAHTNKGGVGSPTSNPTAAVIANNDINSVRIRHLGSGSWEFSIYNYSTASWDIVSTQSGGPDLATTMYAHILQETVAIETEPTKLYKTLEVKTIDIIQE